MPPQDRQEAWHSRTQHPRVGPLSSVSAGAGRGLVPAGGTLRPAQGALRPAQSHRSFPPDLAESWGPWENAGEEPWLPPRRCAAPPPLLRPFLFLFALAPAAGSAFPFPIVRTGRDFGGHFCLLPLYCPFLSLPPYTCLLLLPTSNLHSPLQKKTQEQIKMAHFIEIQGYQLWAAAEGSFT